MLLLEFGLIGFLGGGIGIGMGVGLLTLIAKQLFNHLAITLPYATVLGLLGLCVLISIVTTMITGWSASGEKPVNVLRYE
jgi:ABC-type antimicrobial peptide transport system permease subunit